jgi:hypothetical protein
MLDFALHRTANPWKVIRFTSFIETIGIEIWDTVTIDFPDQIDHYDPTTGFPLKNVEDTDNLTSSYLVEESGDPVKGFVLDKVLNFVDGTIFYTVLLPIMAGTYTVDPDFYLVP